MNITSFVNNLGGGVPVAIPAAGIGALLGLALSPKANRFDNVMRGTGIGLMTGSGIDAGTRLANMATPTDDPDKTSKLGLGAGAGGLAGLGVGYLLQGKSEAQRKKELRQQINEIVENKLKTAEIITAPQPAANPLTPLRSLITAKQHSDIKDYPAKHRILRNLMLQHPNDFYIDSVDGNIVGLTWKPGKFKIHAPKSVVPDNIITQLNTPRA